MPGQTSKKSNGDRTVANNRRAHFDYELGDRIEAGLVLIGSEVRALRHSGGDLSDGWVDVDNRGEAWLRGMRIPTLQHASFAHEEKRPRKLLLHKDQIEQLRSQRERDGMTLIATRCYFKDGRAKVEIAAGRGRRKHDKRQVVREKEAAREAQAAIRRHK